MVSGHHAIKSFFVESTDLRRCSCVFYCPVQWVETHPQCERMRLQDMQAKPHQRITKYPLLLKAVLKTTEDPQVQHTVRGMVRKC